MGDPIRQPDNVGRVLPLNPARDTGQRKHKRQQPDKAPAESENRKPDDDSPHRVDEYV